jgi:predicted site-specific integrase-resolvase
LVIEKRSSENNQKLLKCITKNITKSNYQYIYFSPLFGIVNVLSKGRFVLKFGYARVSTQDQSLSLQLDALNHYEVDQIFEEKESGKRKNRPQLDELLKVLRKGDTVVIYKLVYHFWESYRRI